MTLWRIMAVFRVQRPDGGNPSPRERKRERERSICLPYSPFRIGHGAKRSRAPSEVGTLDPVRLVLKVVPRQTAGVGRIRLTVHNLKGPSGIGRVAEVLVARDATHARWQDGVSGGAARRRSPRGQASEETAAGLLHRVQLPAGDAVLLLNVLARVQRRRATIPRVHDTARTAEAAVEVYLRGNVHLSQTGAIYIRGNAAGERFRRLADVDWRAERSTRMW